MDCGGATIRTIVYMMAQLDLETIETQLRKRLSHPYRWYRKQNNLWDNATTFIYKTQYWEEFLDLLRGALDGNKFQEEPFTHYAMNRWYNFWSAQAVEHIFTSYPGVAPNPHPLKDHYDFRWLGERFDHKTSVFPKGFEKGYAFAKAYPKELIHWFYKNQSTGQRYHLLNRLFVVCYAKDGAHYKLKAEIALLKNAIETYLENRTPADTFSLQLQEGKETLADIIWVAR